jgi:hypothetical protein
VTNSPITPSAISSRAVTTSGQYCAFSPTMNTVSARRAAARIRAQASAFGAMGFSSRTCFPASRQRTAASSCSAWGSRSRTASKPPASRAASRDA